MKGLDNIRVSYLIVIAILASIILVLVSPGSNKAGGSPPLNNPKDRMAGGSPPLNNPKDRMAGSSPPLNDLRLVTLSSAPSLEGCLKCHDQIEPMHRFGPTATL